MDSDDSAEVARRIAKEERTNAATQKLDPVQELFRKHIELMSRPIPVTQAMVMKPCSFILMYSFIMLIVYFIAAGKGYY